MPQTITIQLSPREAADPEIYTSLAARRMGIRRSEVALARVVKRSIDARQRNVKVNLSIEIYVDREPQPAPVHFDYPDVSGRTEVVIVGSGPAGLFAALRLIELGYKPIVLERGRDVSARKRDIAQINRNGEIDPDSNYAFGEGGAGTFSDGKLFTRSKKRGDYNKALQTLVYHGAVPDILFEAHPHIGTDRLPRIMTNVRQTILNAGGEFLFDSRVTGLIIKGDRVEGVVCGDRRIDAAAVVMATGHSARDIYRMLDASGVRLEAKAFAMGVRIEHPQALIDSIQYHCRERGEYLPAASYSLVCQQFGRGVYSFCMCPGGFIVPAMTEQWQSVVNGMSPSGRNSVFANSGLVTVHLKITKILKFITEALAGILGVPSRKGKHLGIKEGIVAHRRPVSRDGLFIKGVLILQLHHAFIAVFYHPLRLLNVAQPYKHRHPHLIAGIHIVIILVGARFPGAKSVISPARRHITAFVHLAVRVYIPEYFFHVAVKHPRGYLR